MHHHIWFLQCWAHTELHPSSSYVVLFFSIIFRFVYSMYMNVCTHCANHIYIWCLTISKEASYALEVGGTDCCEPLLGAVNWTFVLKHTMQRGRSQTDSSWLSLSHCRHYREASSCPPASSLLLVFVLVLWDKDTILFLIFFLLWSWEPNPSALPLNSKYSTIELSLQPPRCLCVALAVLELAM